MASTSQENEHQIICLSNGYVVTGLRRKKWQVPKLQSSLPMQNITRVEHRVAIEMYISICALLTRELSDHHSGNVVR